MKKIIFSAALATLLLASCKDDKNPTADPAPTPPPVEDPAPAERPEPTTRDNNTTTTTTTTTTTEDPDGTSISIDRNGVDINRKDGDDKVRMSTKTKEVEIRTTE